jgi:hypothetical protein
MAGTFRIGGKVLATHDSETDEVKVSPDILIIPSTQTLPSSANDGEIVIVNDSFGVYSDNQWNYINSMKKYSYAKVRYGPFTVSHHSRVSRIFVIDNYETQYDVQVFVADNCADTGTCCFSDGQEYIYDSSSDPKFFIGFGIYSSFGGGSRGGYISLEVSNDQLKWTQIVKANVITSSCGEYIIKNV